MSFFPHALLSRALRRTRSRSSVQRVAGVLAVSVLAGLGVACAEAAAAHAPVTRTTARAAAVAVAVQSYEVPATAELEAPVRTLEVEARTVFRWVAPAKGELRDGFGPRPDAPVAGVSGFHRGQDIGARCGAPIRAATSGRVLEAGWDGNYGQAVRIADRDGTETLYAHASRLLVHEGERVKAGERIAEAGSTGASTGCHLHFEVREGDHAVDPAGFLLERGVRLGR